MEVLSISDPPCGVPGADVLAPVGPVELVFI